MASTFHQLLYHLVFSTKRRQPLITEDVREPLYKYVGGVIRNHDGSLIEIGGVADHVHCLVRLPARIALAEMLKMIKADSSRWINRERPGERFAWQVGYGAFTVSPSQKSSVRRYIRNQEEHHREVSFREEFLLLLDKHGVEYEPRYVFD